MPTEAAQGGLKERVDAAGDIPKVVVDLPHTWRLKKKPGTRIIVLSWGLGFGVFLIERKTEAYLKTVGPGL